MMMNDDEGRRIVRTIFASVLNFTFIDARMWVNKSPQSVKIWTFLPRLFFTEFLALMRVCLLHGRCRWADNEDVY